MLSQWVTPKGGIMLIRLLGNVDALGDEGEVPIRGERRRSVLAALALRPGELVSVDRIVDAVWGEDPPATARNTIQVHVGYLRRTLGAPEVIAGRAPGYVLSLPGPATDVAVVDDLLARATVAAGPAERLPLLEKAASYWRTTPLADVGESAYLARHAHVLDELRLTTTERLLADHLRQGHHTEVVDQIATLVAEQPDRDRPTQLLMTALYRCGRRAEALAAYGRLEATQRATLGVEPGPALQSLHGRILRGDPDLHVPATGPRRSAGRPVVEATRTLRRPLSRLIGRDDDRALLATCLDRSRLVTVVGMGGVGKTRLALELARARGTEHRVDVIDLTPAGPELEQVAHVVASALAVQLDNGQTLSAALVSALAGPGRLLVLDNCEHVVDAAATLVADLLSEAPDLTVLATSREPLHVDGEECLHLNPLAVDRPAPSDAMTPADALAPAVAMLLDRAKAADPAYDPTPADLPLLEDLCRQVDGLPLALEIIGPRLRSLTARELADGIGTRLLSWRDQRRETTDRHRTIASLMEWGYALLEEPEARALDRLSVLRGGAWLVEAAALCEDDQRSGEDLVLALIDRSLLTRSEVEGRSRVSVHPLVSAFAATRLAATGTAGMVAERHARWVAATVAEDARHWRGPDEAGRLRWRTLDAGNVQAALEWLREHDPSQLCAMVDSLWWWWYRTGEGVAGYAWGRTAVRAGAPDDRTAVAAHLATGYLAWLVDEYDEARDHAEQALRLAGSDPAVVGFAHGILSRARGDEGDFAAAISHAETSVAAYERAHDTWGATWSRRCLAVALLYAGGRLEESDAVCRVALAAFRALGDGWGLAGALATAASVRAALGDLDTAREMGTEAVLAHRALGDASGERRALQQLAQLLWTVGALDDARAQAAASLELSEEHGYLVGALQALLLLEDVAQARGDPAEAARLGARAAELVTRLGSGADLSLSLARRRRAG